MTRRSEGIRWTLAGVRTNARAGREDAGTRRGDANANECTGD